VSNFLAALAGSEKSSESDGASRTLLSAAPYGGAAADGCVIVLSERGMCIV